ncbi:hypothetical protein JUN65_00115 [Gluconacetobacter azotocaptans]|uniref:hypothetical protein n=1 Tax=Gluconacetobacter azotocaptans TaxID=142834 RepID=UPI0019592C31|nr:hypothetical protein [Gluconacetobacter azotocaptans]MBM9400004.1 hypothetical protein [Gluconacetobacter azotocaptans]
MQSAAEWAWNTPFCAIIKGNGAMRHESGLSFRQREETARQIAAALAYLRHEARAAGFPDTVSALEDLEKTVVREGLSAISGGIQDERQPS